MRSHWITGTRKLNKHYQSAGGGVVPPVPPIPEYVTLRWFNAYNILCDKNEDTIYNVLMPFVQGWKINELRETDTIVNLIRWENEVIEGVTKHKVVAHAPCKKVVGFDFYVADTVGSYVSDYQYSQQHTHTADEIPITLYSNGAWNDTTYTMGDFNTGNTPPIYFVYPNDKNGVAAYKFNKQDLISAGITWSTGQLHNGSNNLDFIDIPYTYGLTDDLAEYLDNENDYTFTPRDWWATPSFYIAGQSNPNIYAQNMYDIDATHIVYPNHYFSNFDLYIPTSNFISMYNPNQNANRLYILNQDDETITFIAIGLENSPVFVKHTSAQGLKKYEVV